MTTIDKLNPHVLLVMKWLNDQDSVGLDELEDNRAAARAAAADASISCASYASYTYAADAAAWVCVDRYFDFTGESKQDYINTLETEK